MLSLGKYDIPGYKSMKNNPPPPPFPSPCTKSIWYNEYKDPKLLKKNTEKSEVVLIYIQFPIVQ